MTEISYEWLMFYWLMNSMLPITQPYLLRTIISKWICILIIQKTTVKVDKLYYLKEKDNNMQSTQLISVLDNKQSRCEVSKIIFNDLAIYIIPIIPKINLPLPIHKTRLHYCFVNAVIYSLSFSIFLELWAPDQWGRLFLG